MTLSEKNIIDPSATTEVFESTINLNSLYCSHLWANSNLRNAIITAPNKDKNYITYCYTCKGKIRKYEFQATKNFTPHNHSTPNKQTTIDTVETTVNELRRCPIDENPQTICSYKRSTLTDYNAAYDEIKQHIPSISHQVDSDITHKFRSYEMDTNETSRDGGRLRKSLKGFGCVINFASTDSPMKKRTQIQACSISVMIIAIVIISFILVNFNHPNFIGATNIISTTIVPTKNTESNETASAVSNIYSDLPDILKVNSSPEVYFTTTKYPITVSIKINSHLSNVIPKIRKNIRTYPKSEIEKEESEMPKDINNRDLSQRFCSCQKNEICMLDENSGTSICRKSTDVDDPTGCGGLCALETEACQLVDKARGVRVCRLLTQVTCSPDEWRCRNGLCVPAEARCNGSIQCYDRSDEMYCECDLTKQFRCGHSISCFPQTKLCDGVIDCWDGHDEMNCTTECPEDQFTCNDSQCILASRFCDGLSDCADGSDEPDGCGGGCGKHELRCRNQRCVPRATRCDGHDNCGDATDEMQCPQ